MHSEEEIRILKKRKFDDYKYSPPVDDTMEIDASSLSLKPTKYQMEVFEAAKKGNTIAHSEIGAENSLIAVMLIEEIAKSVKLSGRKRLIIFLAPTVGLVHQNFMVMKFSTELQVDAYHGSRGIDLWNGKSWESEIDKNDVMVMTPQILLDALRKAFLKFEMICLLVLDECHHTKGNHPYAKLIKEFYHNSEVKPKVFGMTGSPEIKKGISSAGGFEKCISKLEAILESQIYSNKIRAEQKSVIPSTTELYRFYDPAVCSNPVLKRKLESTWLKFNSSLGALEASLSDSFRDTDDKQVSLGSRMSSIHQMILFCIDDLGLICALEAVKILTEKSPDVNKDCEFSVNSSLQLKNYLEEVLQLVKEHLPQGHESLSDVGCDHSQMVSTGLISPKLHELIRIFNSFSEAQPILCLVYVDRIIKAKAIERVLKKMTYLSHLSASHLTGNNGSVNALTTKLEEDALESFCSGKVNLLFTTDVEGIHVPNRSTMIYFDLPTTGRSYVQLKGQACQNYFQHVMMLERGNLKQRAQVFNNKQSEYCMLNTVLRIEEDAAVFKPCDTKGNAIAVDATTASVKEEDASILKPCNKDMNAYTVDVTGASAREEDASNLKSCNTDLNAYSMDVSVALVREEDSSVLNPCKENITSYAADVAGALVRAEDASFLKPCNKDLNTDAVDVTGSSVREAVATKKNKVSSTGTTKRKELHGTTCTRALSGTWGKEIDNAAFFAYKLDFVCNIPDQQYSSFIFLIESKLEDDVANLEVDLYLVNKFVKSSVSSCGQVHLNAEQVRKSMCFQEFFFNGLFGKLFVRSGSKKGREFLLQADVLLWSPSNMYLLLPLEFANTPSRELWKIDWAGIDSCVSEVDFLKKNAWLSAEQSGNVIRSSKNGGVVGSDLNCAGNIRFANRSVPITNTKDMVVMSVHTGRFYTVLKVLVDTSAESSFDGDSDEAPSNYSSFIDYFQKKYGISLVHPEQPLLLMKQSHKAHNLLVNFKEGFSSKKKKETKSKKLDRKPYELVRIPPELLVAVDVRLSVLKSMYLLPSVVHRLETLMLASQLRDEIKSHCGNFQISSSLILEALTTTKYNSSFSMERLELLGDSVLKYVLSCHLFFKYPDKHEGQLSECRTQAVRNSTLHKFGTDKKIQGYIRDSPFDPLRWTAPGQQSIQFFPCEHGVDTPEVPLDSKFVTEDPKIKIGKCCDMGHRWMGSKTISDCVEALIGAYYIGGGLMASIQLMKWFGMDVEVQPLLLDEAIKKASLHSYNPKDIESEILEAKLEYKFLVKGLLVEAITHASDGQVEDRGYSYERLEFLGDSVLDILITVYLYQSHTDIDPGELTDLRSASVNNENFAQAAVRRKLHLHLKHCPGLLSNQITEYASFVSGLCSNTYTPQAAKCPKALGDLVESIAGAILVDSRLNLDEVWRVFKPILSPIVTPDKLELPPLRELILLCDSLGFFIKESCLTRGETVFAELSVQLEDTRLSGEGFGQNRKIAKGNAAFQLLKDLEGRGFSLRKQNQDPAVDSSSMDSVEACPEALSVVPSFKKQKTCDFQTTTNTSSANGVSELNILVKPINRNKGGPRIALYDVCRRTQWPLPKFETAEEKSRSPIEFTDGLEKRQGFSSFVSEITLTIPDRCTVVVNGQARPDKKSSLDSGCLMMLYELEQRGFLTIEKS
ncbi:endoribonuclease Dicer homolog 3 isoform X2 [Daucus carota subsp. sativus]|uniref:endoribonuclease Dicer homolog 3 isoform X2 n=1 Tax=Daucus carota subsp. sativus TaxID=79200 RepID=UPI0007EF7A38|nr:PREDICTED: endoribonuclease Dicer homolog 3-like isoform X2 [Daucus carota subsp. sativus]